MTQKTQTPSQINPVPASEAIKAAGGTRIVRERLGVSRQSLHTWKVVPYQRCAAIAELSGIPREVLRPDVFG